MDEELEEEEEEDTVAVVGEGESSRVLEDGLDPIEGFEGGLEDGKGGKRGSNSLREEEEDTALGSPTGTAPGTPPPDSLTKRSISASQMVARG